MRRLRRSATRLLAIALLLPLSACSESATLTLGSSPTEPASAIASAIEAIAARYELPVKRVGYASEAEVAEALAAGDLDLAVLEHPPGPVAGIGVVSSLYPSVLHVLTRNEDACASGSLYGALSDGAIFPGNAGSAGARLLTELSDIGLAPAIPQMQLLSSAFGAQPDTFLIFGGLLSEDARRRLAGYCLLSLAEAERTFSAGVAFRFPHLEPFVLPDGVYPELASREVNTLAVRTLLLGRRDLPDAVAFDLSDAIASNSAELGQAYPLARAGVFAELDPSRLSLPVLPGTRRYMDKDSPGILERYAEILALLITIGIALSSALVAALRLRRQARKDRLDSYFAQLLELRSRLDGNSKPADIAADIRKLQGTVTRLVIDERVEADASFMAFVTLSAEVLREASVDRPLR